MLLIDCHEPKEIIDKLRSDIKVEVLSLKYGDYSFSDAVIERKTLSDFFSSLKSKRLHSQLDNMNLFYKEKYLLIEGFFDFSYVNNIDFLYKQIENFTLDFNAKILFSMNISSTADLIRRIYFKKNIFYMPGLKKDKIYYASKFFGISVKKLRILNKRFGSISNILKADKKELKSLEFIGEKTIKNIRERINSDIVR